MRNIRKIFVITLVWSVLFGCGLHAHAADGVAFNPVPVPVMAKGAGGVPVGTVIVWPVSTPPDEPEKWLECDGRSTAGYPELASKVGGTVPDYRGFFLRGNGGASAMLGQQQSDAIRNITGSIFGGDSTGGGFSEFFGDDSVTGNGSFYVSTYRYQQGIQNTGSASGNKPHSFHFDASRVVPTAPENRPINKSVRYLIKAISFNFNIRQYAPWEEILKKDSIALLHFEPCLTS